ncbi:thymus-specific serine protease-like [Rhopilema esculentum]|uniref:thymus-specific serine protease-like n=1 Tax=Rhopilema esculentum TaxID=499914 RepID=UPI0031DA4A7A
MKKMMEKILENPEASKLLSSVQTGWVQQKLDNFNPANPQYFYQRYYVSTLYWDPSTGPVFVYVGGEDELVPGYLAGGEIVELAQKYKALLLGLEHRYYGKSMPTDGMKLENIKYLSSRQALQDLRNFHNYITRQYRLTSYNRWILQGGSYPGALAAWGRSKLSDIIHGSVASSAPLVAQVDFPEYMEVVAASLAAPEVGGSDLCRDSVKKGFETIETLIKSKQFSKLKNDFSSCNDISSPNDTAQFVVDLSGVFTNVVQYNDETPWMDIRKICGFMTDTYKTPYERLMDVNKAYMDQVQIKCVGNSYQGYINSLKWDQVDPSGYANARQWYYQTCTEFGYYQSCEEGTSCVFSSRITMNSMINICQAVYNITSTQVYQSVTSTNKYYGGKSLGVSRIVFPNGSIDPWHALSILKNQTVGEVAVYMKGVAHCANMNPSEPNDPLSLKSGRKMIDALVGEWLK